MDESEFNAYLAKLLTAACVRNTYLEDLHAGIFPSSETGDYEDVKVVSPYGESPWNRLSRLNNDEMKILIKEVVNKLYTFFERQDDPEFIATFESFTQHFIRKWDQPELLESINTIDKH